MAVNRKNIRKWVKALRSGKFKQCKNTLIEVYPGKKDIRYCCLGVACVVAGAVSKDSIKETKRDAQDSGCPESVAIGYDVSVLPAKVQKWLGVEDQDPILGKHEASTWNDSKGASFKKIASLIEKEYLK